MAVGYTDENGVVVFTGRGEYLWIASKEGYVTKNGKVQLDRDMEVNITLDLTPPAISLGGILSVWSTVIVGAVASILWG